LRISISIKEGLKDVPVLKSYRRNVYLQSFPSLREGRIG